MIGESWKKSVLGMNGLQGTEQRGVGGGGAPGDQGGAWGRVPGRRDTQKQGWRQGPNAGTKRPWLREQRHLVVAV